jgi:hypothetical protein
MAGLSDFPGDPLWGFSSEATVSRMSSSPRVSSFQQRRAIGLDEGAIGLSRHQQDSCLDDGANAASPAFAMIPLPSR